MTCSLSSLVTRVKLKVEAEKFTQQDSEETGEETGLEFMRHERQDGRDRTRLAMKKKSYSSCRA